MGKGGGGHGGLNILPQKSWNVYGWEQRERVRRDEEEAEEAERAVTAEVDQKKRDERRAVLLARASGESGKRLREDSSAQLASAGNEHINFFREAEEADAKYRAAKAAQPAPDESHRLGHGAEKDKALPWYASKTSTMYDKAPRNSDSLPARVRREKEETLALRGSFSSAAPALLLTGRGRAAAGAGAVGSAGAERQRDGGDKRPAGGGAGMAAAEAKQPAKARARYMAGAPPLQRLLQHKKKTMEELRAERIAREEAERRRERAVLVASLPPSLGDAAEGGFGGSAGGQRYNTGFGNAPPKRRRY